MKIAKVLFPFEFIIILLSLFKIIDTQFKCNHSFNETIRFLKPNKTEIKRKLDVKYSPIKIKYDFRYFKKPKSIDDDALNNIKKIIEDTAKEFQKFLKVQHSTLNLNDEEKK